MSDHKKKAWFVTAFLLFILLTWAIYAVHDSAVAAARAARASNSGPSSGCPFAIKSSDASPNDSTKKPCCHSTNSVKAPESTKPDFKSLANMPEEELDEFMKQFTPEQLAKCPHLKSRTTKNKNKNK